LQAKTISSARSFRVARSQGIGMLGSAAQPRQTKRC
jgi:hypothetical protein